MSLEGGLIDDISFKKHKQNLENNLNIEFLNPAQTEDGFYVETGWTSIGNKIKVPSKKSMWKVKGNKIVRLACTHHWTICIFVRPRLHRVDKEILAI